jgi:hypothetical protein
MSRVNTDFFEMFNQNLPFIRVNPSVALETL